MKFKKKQKTSIKSSSCNAHFIWEDLPFTVNIDLKIIQSKSRLEILIGGETSQKGKAKRQTDTGCLKIDETINETTATVVI